MNVVVIGQRQFTGPAGWDELTPKQFLQVLNWRMKLGGEPAGRWVLLQLWYGIRYPHSRLLSDEQRADLTDLLSFLDERPSRWLLPKLWLRGRPYGGPGDGLEHLSFGEFMYAESARNRDDLVGLLASLYRPRAAIWQRAGDAGRRLFDARHYERQKRRMAVAPVAVQQGVLMNYLGCLDQFPATFPHLFNQSAGGGDTGTWLDVGISLARQTGALGTFLEMERTNLYLVLTALDALMKDNRTGEPAELKAKAEQWKN